MSALPPLPVPHDLVTALISGAAVQLLDACRMLTTDEDVEAAEMLAWAALRMARDEAQGVDQ